MLGRCMFTDSLKYRTSSVSAHVYYQANVFFAENTLFYQFLEIRGIYKQEKLNFK